MNRIPLLPHWVITDKYPAFYDVESATAVEQTSKLYGKMQELIEDYNKYVDEINKTITEFIEGTNSDQEEFVNRINKIMHDYIAMLDEKIKQQDQVIEDNIIYIKNNLIEGITEIMHQMRESGELDEVIAESFNSLDTRVTKLEKTIVKSVAEMKELQNLNAGDIIKTIGYHSANDGGSALYQIVDDSELINNDSTIISLKNNLHARLVFNDEVTDKQLGFTEKTNIATKLQTLLNDSNFKGTIKFTKNSIYYIENTVTLDLWKNSIDGNGCYFISKINDETKHVFNIGSSYNNNDNSGDLFTTLDGSPYENFSNCFFKNLTLQYYKDTDNTYLYKSNAIKFNNDIGKCAHLTFERLSIIGFKDAITLCSNFYMNSFIGLMITNCYRGIYAPADLEDTGEKISFKNGMISSCDYAFYIDGEYDIHNENMSIDYNYKIAYMNGARLLFTNCHLENPQRTTRRYRNGTGRTGLETALFDCIGTNNYSYLSLTNCTLGLALQKTGDEKIVYDYLINSDKDNFRLNMIGNRGNIMYEYLSNKGYVVNIGFRTKVTYNMIWQCPDKQIYPDRYCDNANMIYAEDRITIDNGYKVSRITTDGKQNTYFKLPKIDGYFKLTWKISGDLTTQNPTAYLFQAKNGNDETTQWEKIKPAVKVTTKIEDGQTYTYVRVQPYISYDESTDDFGLIGLLGNTFNKNMQFFASLQLRTSDWNNYTIKEMRIEELESI